MYKIKKNYKIWIIICTKQSHVSFRDIKKIYYYFYYYIAMDLHIYVCLYVCVRMRVYVCMCVCVIEFKVH